MVLDNSKSRICNQFDSKSRYALTLSYLQTMGASKIKTELLAVVTPLLKKPGLESLFKNLRPVSNLAHISKLTERAVFNQIYDHLVRSGLYPQLQSAYRRYHSTETALVKVANDILLNMNSQRVTLLVLLDLSAAFDTVDHAILLKRLTTDFGIGRKALEWFSSYLSGRSRRFLFEGTTSDS